MIENLPTFEGLNETALRLYVRAWMNVVGLMHAFDSQYDEDGVFDLATDDMWKEERAEFVEAVQEELQASLAVVQQCNELALKARICAVSPYLLLLNTEIRFATSNKPIDFADLRTLDAVDLPKAVNTLCPSPLPQTYVVAYGRMRQQRNQFTHLGVSSRSLEPRQLLVEMVDLYLALWPERAWLTDRVDFATVGSDAFFEGKHFSPRLDAMYEMPYVRSVISTARWKKLFGIQKSGVRFVCPGCADDWAVSRNAPWTGGAEHTAHYDAAAGHMHCLMCSGDFKARKKKCGKDDCDSAFIVAESVEEHAGKCFRCGTDRLRDDALEDSNWLEGGGASLLPLPVVLNVGPKSKAKPA